MFWSRLLLVGLRHKLQQNKFTSKKVHNMRKSKSVKKNQVDVTKLGKKFIQGLLLENEQIRPVMDFQNWGPEAKF